jgi:hypothetical protein
VELAWGVTAGFYIDLVCGDDNACNFGIIEVAAANAMYGNRKAKRYWTSE